jgi:WD40 repeat protein
MSSQSEAGPPHKGSHGEVTGLAFLRGSAALVATYANEKMRLLDPATIHCQRTATTENGWLTDLAVSPNESILATANVDGTIGLWNAASWESMTSLLQGHTDWVLCVLFSKDAKYLFSAGRDRRILAWDFQTKAIDYELTGHKAWVECLALSSDGTLLASGDWLGTIKIWNLPRKECVATISAHEDAILSVVFSPDDRILVSGAQDSKPLKIWSTDNWKEQASLDGGTRSARSVLFLSNDELVVGSNDHMIRIWNLRNETCISAWKAHQEGWVMQLALSSDKKQLASGDLIGEVKVWNVDEMKRSGANVLPAR